MSNELGPIDLDCDAPPYPVVRACQRLGLRSPQDVRWCHVNRLTLTGRSACRCGEAIPLLESYTFTFITGNQKAYFLAQCGRCQTIFWDKAP